MNYASQRESDHDRLYRRVTKLYDRVSVRSARGHRRKRPWIRRRTLHQTMAGAEDYDRASLHPGLRDLMQSTAAP